MENRILNELEKIQKEISIYERKGLDSSSLKIFIKNFKEFIKLNEDIFNELKPIPFEEKLLIIEKFLEDKKAFPTIGSVIEFANNKLDLGFKDQKESRKVTISRIIGRIKSKPELKDKLKKAVLEIRNEKVHTIKSSKTKKEVISAETFSKWADIIKNI
ncbi:hypothetical protein [Sunxiuqinia elliptica]|uniref:Uncharacterized protein n=1 Tax=Sunxiuqinia elliptica TaxID=655355 RepID=A0A1I2KXE8_9BACT|nr:hypothetical protein [Sunxiuqinia elliptica]SFF69847.1 hypothetical protein SAMN05216283_11358 [Sunxiuqinia elliptica]